MKKTIYIYSAALILLMLLTSTGCTRENDADTAAELQYTAVKASALNFNASLKGANEVPAVTSNGAGQAHMQLNKSETTLSFKVTASNLENVIQAHIHLGPPDESGPVVAFLYGPAVQPSGPQNGFLSEGTIEEAQLLGPLSGDFAGLVEALREGNIYVNVHTTAFPGGEIRGQL